MMASEKDDKKYSGWFVVLASLFAFRLGKKTQGKNGASAESFLKWILYFIAFAFVMAGIRFLIDRPALLAVIVVAVAVIVIVVACIFVRSKKNKRLKKESAETVKRQKIE